MVQVKLECVDTPVSAFDNICVCHNVVHQQSVENQFHSSKTVRWRGVEVHEFEDPVARLENVARICVWIDYAGDGVDFGWLGL